MTSWGIGLLYSSKLSASLKGSGWDEEILESFLQESETESLDTEEDGETPPRGVESWVGRFLHRALCGGGNRLPVPAQIAEGPFDFLEVYAGRHNMTSAWTRSGFRVLPPLELQGDWDLCDQSLFWG